jgi:sugar phosphate isomerase/epimerase
MLTRRHFRRSLSPLGLAMMILLGATVSPLARAEQPVDAHHAVAGLQVYSLRAQMAKDLPASMAKIQSWGVTDVELGALFNLTAEQYRAQLDAHHLRASGIHCQWDRFSKDLDGVIHDAKVLGCEYVTLPWIPHKGDFTADAARTACEKFNDWGKKLAEAGLHFTYHPHGYEFGPYQDGTVFDLMVSLTKPQWVNFELDIFWAYRGAAEPVKLMQKYPTRFPELHLKDMDKSFKIPANLAERVSPENDVVLGAGQIDIAGVLRQGMKIGVKHYYIEDESSRSEQQIPPSIQFIDSVKAERP